MIDRNELIATMVDLLEVNLREHKTDGSLRASANLPLVGPEAALGSLGLVSFLADVESALAEKYDLEATLASEKAFSRSRSPFRSVETLADYILELASDPSENGLRGE
jgi:hypothetical protein